MIHCGQEGGLDSSIIIEREIKSCPTSSPFRDPKQTISHPQSPAPMHLCRFQFAPKAFHSFPEVNISLSTIAAGLHF